MNQLKEANQLRAARAKCLPLFALAEGIPDPWQESIYRTMVLHIAAVLGVKASAHDLNLEQWIPVEDQLGPIRFVHGTEWTDFLGNTA